MKTKPQGSPLELLRVKTDPIFDIDFWHSQNSGLFRTLTENYGQFRTGFEITDAGPKIRTCPYKYGRMVTLGGGCTKRAQIAAFWRITRCSDLKNGVTNGKPSLLRFEWYHCGYCAMTWSRDMPGFPRSTLISNVSFCSSYYFFPVPNFAKHLPMLFRHRDFVFPP